MGTTGPLSDSLSRRSYDVAGPVSDGSALRTIHATFVQAALDRARRLGVSFSLPIRPRVDSTMAVVPSTRAGDIARGPGYANPVVGRFDDELRAAAEKEFWAQRDPIKRLAADLIAAGLVSEGELKEIEREVDAEIRDCVEFALAAPEPDGSELTRYIWAED